MNESDLKTLIAALRNGDESVKIGGKVKITMQEAAKVIEQVSTHRVGEEMSILDELSAAYTEGNTAKVISLMPQLMDARNKTIFEMPCAVGDTVYFPVDKGTKWAMVMPKSFELSDFSYIGETVFLTEAEAKKALEAKQ